MKSTLASKSKKTCDRVEEIKFSFKSYKESVALLHAYAEERASQKNKAHSTHAKKRMRIPEDKDLYLFTLQNIKTQMALLERELSVLLEYGA